jgi:hypothetical protein
LFSIGFGVVTAPAEWLKIRRVEAALGCVADRSDMVDHRCCGLTAALTALPAEGLGLEDGGAELAPIAVIAPCTSARARCAGLPGAPGGKLL